MHFNTQNGFGRELGEQIVSALKELNFPPENQAAIIMFLTDKSDSPEKSLNKKIKVNLALQALLMNGSEETIDITDAFNQAAVEFDASLDKEALIADSARSVCDAIVTATKERVHEYKTNKFQRANEKSEREKAEGIKNLMDMINQN